MIKNFKQFENRIERAKEFAKQAHSGQFRRGKDEQGNKIEYFIHPDAVAQIVQRLKHSHKIAHLIAAAYLHDTLEDTDTKIEQIKEEFGDLVASLVEELTSDEEQLKILGKENYLTQKLLTMSSWGLVIKLADRLHNVSDIPNIMKSGNKQRIKWAKRYAGQTKGMITVLRNQRKLSKTQEIIVNEIEEKIKEAIL